MFSNNNESSGMVGFLVGIIILVFAGIFFSLLADKRFSFSSNKISLQQTFEEEHRELEAVKKRLENARIRWKTECEPLLGQRGALESASADSRSCGSRLAGLRDEKALLVAAVSAAADQYGSYQDRYRQQVRGDGMGEKMAELRSQSGRIYKNVTVSKVSAAGIEIRHDEGVSRLLPEDLDPSWDERFQWDQEEMARLLQQERSRENRHGESVDKANAKAQLPAPKPASRRKPPKEKDPEDAKLEELRQAVVDARDRLNDAQAEVARARMEAVSNKGRSVPGSLETWSQRAARLETSSAKLRAQYVSARGALATVAPNDALLKISEQQ